MFLVCLVFDSCVRLANCQCLTCTMFLFMLPYRIFKSVLFSFQILFYILNPGGVAIIFKMSINLQRPARSALCVQAPFKKCLAGPSSCFKKDRKQVARGSRRKLIKTYDWSNRRSVTGIAIFFAHKLAQRLNSGFCQQQGQVKQEVKSR